MFTHWMVCIHQRIVNEDVDRTGNYKGQQGRQHFYVLNTSEKECVTTQDGKDFNIPMLKEDISSQMNSICQQGDQLDDEIEEL